ncbi:28S ribosomal protein S14, mitochondrial [Fopius arisanus]|uniref:28S ribosomal protein S14, mitochondrial n=1 Tax=Fopius arisanus TaxID=64838 RepID=A0A0C9QSW1_9HYME|nr:PREDICTED: 28S ribosomal protein S14, mitochondrial [Fopius arisanus]
MATAGLFASTLSRIFSNVKTGCHIQQTRNKWANARMLRDYKRRCVAKEYAPLRVRLLTMKRNNILPREIQDIASKEMLEVPRHAAMCQLTGRCAITSRPRGNLMRWRLSRFVFRRLVDYNQLAGVQRALWG